MSRLISRQHYEACCLAKTGKLTYTEIGNMLGVTRQCVDNYLTPEARVRHEIARAKYLKQEKEKLELEATRNYSSRLKSLEKTLNETWAKPGAGYIRGLIPTTAAHTIDTTLLILQLSYYARQDNMLFTQQDVADAVGVTRQTVNQILRRAGYEIGQGNHPNSRRNLANQSPV